MNSNAAAQTPVAAPVISPLATYTAGTSCTIAWSSVLDAADYYAEVDDAADFSSPNANSGYTTATQYTFTGLTNGTKYYYRVKARRADEGTTRTWTQTSQTDFQANTLTNVSLTRVPGSASLVKPTYLTNPSFESGSAGWSSSSSFPGALTATVTNAASGGFPTNGSYYLQLKENTPYTYTAGYTVTYYQDVDLTGFSFFSAQAQNGPTASWQNLVQLEVMIDSTTYYTYTAAGNYSPFFSFPAMTGVHRISFVMKVRTTAAPSTTQYIYVDNCVLSPTPGNATGNMVTAAIQPLPFNKWLSASFTPYAPTAGTSATVDILPAAGSTPISGYSNISTPTDLTALATYPIRLRTNLSTNDVLNNTPELRDWTLTYLDGYTESGWSASVSSTQDATSPTGDIIDIAPDPRSTGVQSVQIEFNEPVIGFNLSSLSLSRAGGPNLLTTETLDSSYGGQLYSLELGTIDDVPGTYTLSLSSAGIVDRAGNGLASNVSDSWTVVTPGPFADGTSGATWIAASYPQRSLYKECFANVNGRAYRMGMQNPVACLVSDNGTTWTNFPVTTSMVNEYPHDLVQCNGYSYLLENIGSNDYGIIVYRSTDLTNWTRMTVNTLAFERDNYCVVPLGNKLVVTGGRYYYTQQASVLSSTDGSNWSTLSASPGFSARCFHTSVVFGGRVWVIGGFAGNTWGPVDPGILNDVWSSADGVTWRQDTASANFSRRYGHASAVFKEKMYVIGGYDFTNTKKSDIWSTTDGVNWSLVTANAPFGAQANGYARDFHLLPFADFMLAVTLTEVWKTYDGVTWTKIFNQPALPPRDLQGSAVYDGKLWQIGGTNRTPTTSVDRNDVWCTADGSTWTQVTPSAAFSVRSGLRSTAWKNKLWVVGGGLGSAGAEVWNSTDGATWTSATLNAGFAPRGTHALLVFNDKLWVIGGLNTSNSTAMNDVWYSDDGTSWTCATPAAAFSARVDAGSCVHAGKMWIMGGTGSGGALNDVWSSSDGVTWTRAVATAPWQWRYGCAARSTGGRMWLAGGTLFSIGGGNTGGNTEVWSSVDGVSWTRATNKAWPRPRTDATLEVFQNRLYITAGLYFTYDLLNDTWFSPLYGDLTTSPTSVVDFATRGITESPTTRSIVLQNPGDLPIHFTGLGLELLGADAAEFALVEPVDTSDLPAGQQRSIIISFDPATLGAKAATLRISTDDPDQATRGVSLSGVGTSAVPLTLTSFSVGD